jgi:hypothetical protein
VLPSLIVTSAARALCGDAAHTIAKRAIAHREAAQKIFDADIMLTKP